MYKNIYWIEQWLLDLKRRVKFVLNCSLFGFLVVLFNLFFLNDMPGLAPSSRVNTIAKLNLLFHLNPEVLAGKDQSKDQPMIMILGITHNKDEMYLFQQIQNMIELGNLGSAVQFAYEGFAGNFSEQCQFGIEDPLFRSYMLSVLGIFYLGDTKHTASARALLVYETKKEWMLPYWENLSESEYLTQKSSKLYQEIGKESFVFDGHPWANILGQKPVYIDPKFSLLGLHEEWLDLYRAWIQFLTKEINDYGLVSIDEDKIKAYLDNPYDPWDSLQDNYILTEIIRNARERFMMENIAKRLNTSENPIKLMYVIVGKSHLPGMKKICKQEKYFDRVKFINFHDMVGKKQLEGAIKRILEPAVSLIRENCLEKYVDFLCVLLQVSQHEQENLLTMFLSPKQNIFQKRLPRVMKDDFGELSMLVKPKDKQVEASIKEDNIADWLCLLNNSSYGTGFYQAIQRIVSLNALPPDFMLKHFVLGDILLRNLIFMLRDYVEKQLNGKEVQESLLKDVCESFLLFYRKYVAIFDPMLSLNSYTFYNTMLRCEQMVKANGKTKHEVLNGVSRSLAILMYVAWRNIQEDLDQMTNTGVQEELRELFTEINLESRLRVLDTVRRDLRDILCVRSQWTKEPWDSLVIFSNSSAHLEEFLHAFEGFVGREKSDSLFNEVVRENFRRLLEYFHKTKNSAGIRRLFYFLYKDNLLKDRDLYHFVSRQAFIPQFFNVSDWFNGSPYVMNGSLDVMRSLGLHAFWSDGDFQQAIKAGRKDSRSLEDMLVFLSRLALRFKYTSADNIPSKKVMMDALQDDLGVHGDLTIVVNEADSELSLAS